MEKTLQDQETRIRLLESRMRLIESEVESYKSTDQPSTPAVEDDASRQGAGDDSHLGAWHVRQRKNHKHPKMQAPKIDMEGNPENVENSASRMEDKVLEAARVKLPTRRWEERPVLSTTVNEHVSEELTKHIEEKYRGENVPKTKKQKEMTPDQRKETIQKMLDRSSHKLGIAPITLEHIERVEKQI